MVRLIYLYFVVIAVSCKAQNNMNSLEPEAFKNELLKTNIILIDVRTPDEFSEGHLPGAVNIDFYDDNFSGLIKEKASGKTVYLYCALGNRSAKAVKSLEKKNVKSVHLKGGIEAWKNAGFEITP
jgi:rhodanese-related sulfurtransferase